ncbi:MAG: DUF4270 domain-containing protein [Bacteroidota bacterium]|nr:DUF4270 domain-containing protein [Bacteroidota bacterium]
MKGYSLYKNPDLFFLSLIVTTSSCNSNEETPLLAGVDTTLTTSLVDTTSINLSTVWLNSIANSNTGVLLAGKFYDNLIGTTTASASFQVNVNSSWSVSDEAVFDSINLILPYSGYTYGDTIQSSTLEVRSLAAIIQTETLPPYVGTEESNSYFYESTALYNTSNTPTEQNALATYTFKPRPSGNDSVRIGLFLF